MTEETKNHLMTTTAPAPHYEEDDGLSSFHLDQMGQRVSVFQGARLMKFVSGTYITREGETIDSKREFVVLGLVKLVQKFVGKKLLQTIVVPQRGNFPDVDKMNDEAPREEWGVDLNNKPVGPFVRTLALKLLDASGKFDSYAFVTTSIGGGTVRLNFRQDPNHPAAEG